MWFCFDCALHCIAMSTLKSTTTHPHPHARLSHFCVIASLARLWFNFRSLSKTFWCLLVLVQLEIYLKLFSVCLWFNFRCISNFWCLSLLCVLHIHIHAEATKELTVAAKKAPKWLRHLLPPGVSGVSGAVLAAVIAACLATGPVGAGIAAAIGCVRFVLCARTNLSLLVVDLRATEM